MVRRRAARQELAVAYAVPAGARVDLVERGKRIAHTIARNVRGRPCQRPAPPSAFTGATTGPPSSVAGGSCAPG